MRKLVPLSTLILAVLCQAALAGAPKLINFQGVLTDALGDPVADDNHLVVFTIYDAASGGVSVWSESQNVSTTTGMFAVLLGSVNPIEDTVFRDTPRYLGVQVGADPEMAPRAQMVTSPYTFRTATIDGAQGGVLSGAIEFDDRSAFFDPPYMYLLSEGADTLQAKKLFSHSSASDGGLFFYYPLTQSFGFGISPGISALYIEPTGPGQVGINTQNPQSALDVNGTLRAGGVELGVSPFRSGFQSTIGGGGLNTVSANWATTAGGQFNVSGGEFATVSGGQTDSAAGRFATVPGGNLNSAVGDYSFAAGRRAKALHDGAFVWSDMTNSDFASTGNNQFNVRASGGTRIFSNSSSSSGVTLSAGSGAWSTVSDSTLKENIREVDGTKILEKLSQLDITRWNYETQSASIEHIGPMAQDFYRLFSLGEDDKHINTLDPDGIALAAIKALYEKSKRIDILEFEVAELKILVEKLIANQK